MNSLRTDRDCSSHVAVPRFSSIFGKRADAPRDYGYKMGGRRGAALIITLAFIVLLTGLVFAYFSRATTDRQLSNASFNNAAADLLARSALDVVVSDFKQEIAAAPNVTPANILPKRSGNPGFTVATGSSTPADKIPNLIRRSFRSDAAGVTSRASAVNSTEVSVNGRSISADRWNSHLLIPRANPGGSDIDTSPIPEFIPPDWVLMTRNGPVAFSSWQSSLADRTNANYVVGRYGYAVYDEGGLLDMNVAGYPYPNGPGGTPSVTDIGRKGVLTFADLAGVSSSPYTIMSDSAVNKFVLFRSFATADSTIKVDCSTAAYFTSVCGTSPKGFLNVYLGGCTPATQVGTTQDFGQVNRVSSNASGPIRTDQNFLTRQELIKFRLANCRSGCSAVAAPDALQYLGTFSREQNKPSLPQVRGSSLVFPQRFHLGQFADVMPNPLNANSVQTNFGLRWAGSFWQYCGQPPNTALLSAIPPINTSGPIDFFQYLNYALNPTWTGTTADSANINSTLTIGAAIIDQCHPNTDAYSNTGSLATGSTTTRIDYSGGTVYGMRNFDPNRPAAAPAAAANYYCLNRPFRNVGELGYAYNVLRAATLNFKDPPPSSGTNNDAAILDLFTYNNAGPRSGIVNLNTRQAQVLTAVLTKVLTSDWDSWTSSPLGRGTTTLAAGAANTIVNTTESALGSSSNAALSRADTARFASLATGAPFTTSEEARESVSRAIAEVAQTRTWGLLIDLVAQTGHYPPSATALKNFVVDGEKRYWLHVAIDRFDGSIVGQQLEEVLE